MSAAEWAGVLIAIVVAFGGLAAWVLGKFERLSDRVSKAETDAAAAKERLRGNEERQKERHQELLRTIEKVEGRATWTEDRS